MVLSSWQKKPVLTRPFKKKAEDRGHRSLGMAWNSGILVLTCPGLIEEVSSSYGFFEPTPSPEEPI